MGYGFLRNDYGFVLDLNLIFWKPFHFINCFFMQMVNFITHQYNN
jgi:hypothetical protein